jgi:hypothetical protein
MLGGEKNPLVLDERMLQRTGGGRPPDHERHHHVRKDDDVAKGNDRKGFVEFQGYPAFSISVIGFSLLCTTSRVITHSRIFF